MHLFSERTCSYENLGRRRRRLCRLRRRYRHRRRYHRRRHRFSRCRGSLLDISLLNDRQTLPPGARTSRDILDIVGTFRRTKLKLPRSAALAI